MAEEPTGRGLGGRPEVAGWEDPATGEWISAERPTAKDMWGAPALDPARQPSEEEAARSSRLVVRWVDSDGDVHYRTTSHLTPDYTAADWLRDNYGVEFV